MMTRKLLLFFGSLFILNGFEPLFAQSPTYPIILNEYCVTNVPSGYPDEKGILNDYVEIYNNHTASVSLTGFYLSNDRFNLLKWRFPNNFPAMQPGEYSLVWLSGKNTNDGINFHSNFTIEQCKNQWLIISNSSGVVYDSVFIKPTKASHVRGRVDYDNIGINNWRVFTTKSPKFANGNPSAVDYAPKPEIYLSTETSYTSTTNTGKFVTDGAQLAFIRLHGLSYDSAYSCFNVFYTLNGDYPVPFYTGGNVSPGGTCFKYADSLSSVITLAKTTVVRAIAVAKPTNSLCVANTLPSFCETNTYFIDTEHNTFQSEFGVLSVSLDKADTSWFTTQGTSPTSIHVEYYDNKKQVSEGYAIINRPPQEEWRTAQRGFYISMDDRLGFGCNFEGPIFNVEGLGASDRKIFPTLHLKGGDFESHSVSSTASGTNVGISFGTGLRDVFMQSLAAKYKLNVSPLHIKPVVTFVNGAYWGVYDLREVYDKYYEQYYNQQSPDSLDLHFVHNDGIEGSVAYWDGTSSSLGANFTSEVYNTAMVRPMNSSSDYNTVMKSLDKESFIDYMVLNSYAMNADLWKNNVTLAKGGQKNKPGSKWHFYLWNVPTIFNYTAVSIPSSEPLYNPWVPPCYLYNATNPNLLLYTPTMNAYNGHGNLLTKLMRNSGFKQEYIARYQDLLNGPLKCENILSHFDYVTELYQREMQYHESPASTPSRGKFVTNNPKHVWDTNMAKLRKTIELRCYYFADIAFNPVGCYGLLGPYALSVDVTPAESGKVKLNTTVLDKYIWNGSYYAGPMTFKAIPASEEYAFHHWELNGATLVNGFAESMDSIQVNFVNAGGVLAVFTDKRSELTSTGEKANIPTGFTPNGDGLNDDFRPLGSGEFASDYQIIIYNRWGQEVFRSVDPLQGWDGKYKGQEALTGVYAYFITYKNIYNEDKLIKGNVTLTR